MPDNACKTPAIAGKIEQAEKVRQHRPGPNHSDAVREHRTMAVAPYNARNCGCHQENSDNWKSLGDLAAELVRKAGGK